jgi:ADP-ribose pyrophosphatase YjhB (NUDIX family)
MGDNWASYCAYCGMAIAGDFPRTCGNGHVTYAPPQQVSVVLQPVLVPDSKRGLLVVARTDKVGDVGLALPGGFVDAGETHAQAAARELYEETGLQHKSDAMIFLDEVVVPGRGNDPRSTSLMFFAAPLVAQKDVPIVSCNHEVSGFDLVLLDDETQTVMTAKGVSVALVFPAHQEMVLRYFRQQAKTQT